MELDDLAAGWLSLPELAEQIGTSLHTIRQWIRDGHLVVVERGDPPAKYVPSDLVADGALVKGLGGALTVLADAGYDPQQALRWLLTDDPALAGRPVDFLAQGRHTAVKRRAMTLAF
ncbi:MAG TPA: Rv2175c family DNA-binding protein [Mycobacteriales bacterium]|jgi:hypothetical protein|nr:Rv2175c family DNA-binding protein [Mycobacteriales bacterium]HWB66927.1 Rv2175c family DNA-binding protein [Mycobacteriales bacterium]